MGLGEYLEGNSKAPKDELLREYMKNIQTIGILDIGKRPSRRNTMAKQLLPKIALSTDS